MKCPYCDHPAPWRHRLLMRVLPVIERACARLDRHIVNVCAACGGKGHR